MKTTIELPDAVLHRAKVIEATHRTTLKELVRQGLERVMADGPVGSARERALKHLEQG